MDKRDRAVIFRTRLLEAMASQGLTRSGLAREIGIDRSTIGQLLKTDLPRLPNAQLAAAAAEALGVSTDWLLGLTSQPEKAGDLVAAAMALSPAERSSADTQLLAWHQEAAGYKVRHVPATLPDLLKTEDMLKWEYANFASRDVTRAVEIMREQLEWLGSGVSDYEIAIPLHELQACASGTAYYEELDEAIRVAQLQFIAKIAEDLFPRLRIFLFDAHTVFSAPITVFGPNLAVVYVGQCYLAFREAQRIKALTQHFDWLVREASVDARDIPGHIGLLLKNRPNTDTP